MTGGAVALRRDDRFGNRTGVFRRDAVTKKNPDNQARKFADADGLWHRAILGSPLAARRHNARRRGAEDEMAKIAIIGGGVIGSSIAYYLALAGYAAYVVVIEPDPTYEF